MSLIKKESNRLFKKTLASILSILFALNPILPIFPRVECGEVNAADNSNWRGILEFPDSLADGTYNTSGSGQTGYINFGKRPEVLYVSNGSNCTAAAGKIKWLIVGKDNIESTNNIVLYSEEPLMSCKERDSSSDSRFNARASDTNANRYNGSNFRNNLVTISESNAYFSSKEQGLMLETEVTAKNDTTSDKLYGLHSDNAGSSYTKIYAGQNNQLPIDISYWRADH